MLKDAVNSYCRITTTAVLLPYCSITALDLTKSDLLGGVPTAGFRDMPFFLRNFNTFDHNVHKTLRPDHCAGMAPAHLDFRYNMRYVRNLALQNPMSSENCLDDLPTFRITGSTIYVYLLRSARRFPCLFCLDVRKTNGLDTIPCRH